MDINVRLGGSGGSGRQAKLSARHSASKAVESMQQANPSSSNMFKSASGGISKALGMASGSSGAAVGALSKVPVVGAIVAGAKLVEGILNFGANIYQARSGEDMLASNFKAYTKTGASLGLNLVFGEVKNYLFTEPRIARQNYMKDYGRELYFQSGYTQKNSLT